MQIITQFELYQRDSNWWTVIDITHHATILFKVTPFNDEIKFIHGSFGAFVDKGHREEWTEAARKHLRECLMDKDIERKQFWFEQGRILGGLF